MIGCDMKGFVMCYKRRLQTRHRQLVTRGGYTSGREGCEYIEKVCYDMVCY